MADDDRSDNFDVIDEEFGFSYRGQDYVLREPTEDANLKHRRKQFSNARMVDDKVQADVSQSVEAPSVLLGECVFKKGEDRPVGAKAVLGWSHRLITMLYDKARAMAGADDAQSIDAQIAKLQELKEKLPDPKKPPPSTASD